MWAHVYQHVAGRSFWMSRSGIFILFARSGEEERFWTVTQVGSSTAGGCHLVYAFPMLWSSIPQCAKGHSVLPVSMPFWYPVMALTYIPCAITLWWPQSTTYKCQNQIVHLWTWVKIPSGSQPWNLQKVVLCQPVGALNHQDGGQCQRHGRPYLMSITERPLLPDPREAEDSEHWQHGGKRNSMVSFCHVSSVNLG